MNAREHRVAPQRLLPANAQDFLSETAESLRELYGPAAAREYLENAPGLLRGTLAHPSVRAFAIDGGGGTAHALVLAVLRPPIAQVVYFHVLERHLGRGLEAALLESTVGCLRNESIEGITAEYLPAFPMEVGPTYEALGFIAEPRTLMLASLRAPSLALDAPVSEPIGPREWDDAARILVEAYRSHPGRRLHLEVRDPAQARSFLQTAANGGYGASDSAFTRLLRDAATNEPAGMIIGSRAAPGVGFVLHVAVTPSHQGKGVGRQLVCDLALAFRQAGYDRVALGVTEGNPARRLYERLEFTPVRSLTAWYWWREALADP